VDQGLTEFVKNSENSEKSVPYYVEYIKLLNIRYVHINNAHICTHVYMYTYIFIFTLLFLLYYYYYYSLFFLESKKKVEKKRWGGGGPPPQSFPRESKIFWGLGFRV
jgi:hypothetical protein